MSQPKDTTPADYPAQAGMFDFWRDGKSFKQHGPGLTKREWFAGMALQGILTDSESSDKNFQWCATLALRMADALLAELAK